MPHAFRSAAVIEAEAAQKKLDRLRDRWVATRDSWFDGTPHSVDRRIGWLDEVIGVAKSTASRLYQSKTGANAMSLLPQLRADRAGLVALHERLLTTAAIPHPEEGGITALPPERIRQMREERRQWRDDDDAPVRHRHEDMGFTPEDVARLKGAAREFIESQNTDDREELLIRAQRHVAERTSSWTPESAQAAVRDFLGAVSAQIPRQVRQAGRVEAAVVEDFDDVLMFS